jgi:tetratricopeptide (TPR) repeat protein
MGQRLLTEPRVLFDYLDLLWMPRPFTPGLFNDQIVASSSLLSPLSTAGALLGLAALLIGAWLLRRRKPILAFAIFFFFVAHLLESSTVALELYFEHRNYIPAMFIFWPLSLWLWDVGKIPADWSRMKIALTLVLIAGLATMTYARADLWGNGQEQALLWAKLNPASARAQANAANHEMAMGRPHAAEVRLMGILRDHPNDPQITLNILSAHCQLGGMTEDDLRLAERTLEHLHSGESVIFHWLGNAIALSATYSCPGLTSQAVASMLDAAERNPRLHRVIGRMQDIYHLRGQLALSLHQPDEALMWYQKALALRPSPQMAFEQAAQLGSAGYPALGLSHLNSFEGYSWTKPATIFGMPRLHAWVLHKQRYWDTELVYLRATLQGDLKHSDEKNSRTLP